MAKYLTEEQLVSNLNIGKSVEQWLSFEMNDDYTVVRWIRIDKEKNGIFSLSYFETFDEGSEDFYDVYEFSPVDPDVLWGKIDSFDSVEAILKFAADEYDAQIDKYVNAGLIQNEYLNYLNNK